jgi:hypothetical protein
LNDHSRQSQVPPQNTTYYQRYSNTITQQDVDGHWPPLTHQDSSWPDHSRREDVIPSSYHPDAYCWNCGERGHVERVCMHGKPIKCHRCGRYGHKEKNCEFSYDYMTSNDGYQYGYNSTHNHNYRKRKSLQLLFTKRILPRVL